MSERRKQLLEGTLTFPEQIMKLVNPDNEDDKAILINEFWSNIWNNFLREKSVNTLIWFDKFNDKNLFNTLLMHLSKAGWITSNTDANYAWIDLNESKLLKWITKEEISAIRFQYKFQKYRLQYTKSTIYDIVQINGKHKQTGLIRKGFMKAGNNIFRYDTKYLSKYINQVATNIMKGLEGSTKDITYQEVIQELLEWYSVDGTEYTLGNCYIDSRGRAIYQCSKKVFNPVSHKDARALLICPQWYLSITGFKAVYAAIAELNGYRGKNYTDKINNGISMYILREMPSLEEMDSTGEYENLHIRIWLERIYDNLDRYDEKLGNWEVPIELDCTASLLQFYGVLLNNYTYMEGTNLIETKEGFQDIWTLPYVSRKHVKKAMTPMLYGSSKHPKELWDANKLEYTKVQLNKMSKEIEKGIFAEANKFKNFIIENVEPKETITVNIRGEIFDIECNRFKWEETKQVDYWIYTSQQSLVKKISKSVNIVPDPEQFKRFFVTLLIHNLDSQVCNNICEVLDWCLPNHDAWTIHPNSSSLVRGIYTSFMFNIYDYRKKILKNYFNSIGITKEYEEKPSKVITNFSPYCLK